MPVLNKVCPAGVHLGVLDSSVLQFEAEISVEGQEKAIQPPRLKSVPILLQVLGVHTFAPRGRPPTQQGGSDRGGDMLDIRDQMLHL
jgi:hypothetical protein